MSHRSRFFIVFSLAALAMSLFSVVDIRHEVGALTGVAQQLRERSQRLRDERRNLRLEYFARMDYGVVRARALALGMRSPSPEDGTAAYLAAEGKK